MHIIYNDDNVNNMDIDKDSDDDDDDDDDNNNNNNNDDDDDDDDDDNNNNNNIDINNNDSSNDINNTSNTKNMIIDYEIDKNINSSYYFQSNINTNNSKNDCSNYSNNSNNYYTDNEKIDNILLSSSDNIDIDDTEDDTSNINYENNFEPSTTNDVFYDVLDAIDEAKAIQGGVGKPIRIENEVFITSQDIEYKFRGDELSFLSITEYSCLIRRKKRRRTRY
jgi:hypothetical protein